MFKHLADYLVHYLWHVRYLGYPLLGGFTIFAAYKMKPKRLTNDLINELEYLYVYCQSCGVFVTKRKYYTAQKMKFSIKNFFSKCDQIRRKLQIFVSFTEEILNEKLHFLCSVNASSLIQKQAKTINVRTKKQ